mmetsp:Transcript_4288/g.6281  ORF Transcript_4288/g.6281 Transcript_4288/m.6281 type:complete len:700 (+) Transcript_4288:60-2159(+)
MSRTPQRINKRKYEGSENDDDHGDESIHSSNSELNHRTAVGAYTPSRNTRSARRRKLETVDAGYSSSSDASIGSIGSRTRACRAQQSLSQSQSQSAICTRLDYNNATKPKPKPSSGKRRTKDGEEKKGVEVKEGRSLNANGNNLKPAVHEHWNETKCQVPGPVHVQVQQADDREIVSSHTARTSKLALHTGENTNIGTTAMMKNNHPGNGTLMRATRNDTTADVAATAHNPTAGTRSRDIHMAWARTVAMSSPSILAPIVEESHGSAGETETFSSPIAISVASSSSMPTPEREMGVMNSNQSVTISAATDTDTHARSTTERGIGDELEEIDEEKVCKDMDHHLNHRNVLSQRSSESRSLLVSAPQHSCPSSVPDLSLTWCFRFLFSMIIRLLFIYALSLAYTYTNTLQNHLDDTQFYLKRSTLRQVDADETIASLHRHLLHAETQDTQCRHELTQVNHVHEEVRSLHIDKEQLRVQIVQLEERLTSMTGTKDETRMALALSYQRMDELKQQYQQQSQEYQSCANHLSGAKIQATALTVETQACSDRLVDLELHAVDQSSIINKHSSTIQSQHAVHQELEDTIALLQHQLEEEDGRSWYYELQMQHLEATQDEYEGLLFDLKHERDGLRKQLKDARTTTRLEREEAVQAINAVAKSAFVRKEREFDGVALVADQRVEQAKMEAVHAMNAVLSAASASSRK